MVQEFLEELRVLRVRTADGEEYEALIPGDGDLAYQMQELERVEGQLRRMAQEPLPGELQRARTRAEEEGANEVEQELYRRLLHEHYSVRLGREETLRTTVGVIRERLEQATRLAEDFGENPTLRPGEELVRYCYVLRQLNYGDRLQIEQGHRTLDPNSGTAAVDVSKRDLALMGACFVGQIDPEQAASWSPGDRNGVREFPARTLHPAIYVALVGRVWGRMLLDPFLVNYFRQRGGSAPTGEGASA